MLDPEARPESLRLSYLAIALLNPGLGDVTIQIYSYKSGSQN